MQWQIQTFRLRGGGWGGLKKTFFPALLASVWSENSVGVGSGGGGGFWGGAGPCPGSPSDMYMYAVGVCF